MSEPSSDELGHILFKETKEFLDLFRTRHPGLCPAPILGGITFLVAATHGEAVVGRALAMALLQLCQDSEEHAIRAIKLAVLETNVAKLSERDRLHQALQYKTEMAAQIQHNATVTPAQDVERLLALIGAGELDNPADKSELLFNRPDREALVRILRRVLRREAPTRPEAATVPSAFDRAVRDVITLARKIKLPGPMGAALTRLVETVPS